MQAQALTELLKSIPEKGNNLLDSVHQLAYRTCMGWATRSNSDEEINAAGRALISRRSQPDEVDSAIGVINNWRSAHAFPLNTMQMRLRDKASEVDRRSPLVAQRIKRLSAIDSKLRRLRNVQLSQMQDIGGCRAIVASNRAVARLSRTYKAGRIRHELERENDYIRNPSADGYRSLHLIYRYFSDRNSQYNGQRVEIQLRSRLQHAWATAVETVDAFIDQQLKINQGEQRWTRFFALIGGHLAFRERTSLVPGTPSEHSELIAELRDLTGTLNVENRLRAIQALIHYIERELQGAYYYLLDLDLDKHMLSVTPYTRAQTEEASTRLAQLEVEYRPATNRDVLLASVPSVKELRRAYPNYFADTEIFLNELRRAIRR